MLLFAYYFCAQTKCLILWISDSFTFVCVTVIFGDSPESLTQALPLPALYWRCMDQALALQRVPDPPSQLINLSTTTDTFLSLVLSSSLQYLSLLYASYLPLGVHSLLYRSLPRYSIPPTALRNKYFSTYTYYYLVSCLLSLAGLYLVRNPKY